jgi:hypothetical protein
MNFNFRTWLVPGLDLRSVTPRAWRSKSSASVHRGTRLIARWQRSAGAGLERCWVRRAANSFSN